MKTIKVICNHIGALNYRIFKPVPINIPIYPIFVKIHYATNYTQKQSATVML